MTKSRPNEYLYIDDVHGHTQTTETVGLPLHHYTGTNLQHLLCVLASSLAHLDLYYLHKVS